MEICRLAGRGRSKQHVPTLPTLPTLASERIEMVGVVPTHLRWLDCNPGSTVLPRAEALVRHAEAWSLLAIAEAASSPQLEPLIVAGEQSILGVSASTTQTASTAESLSPTPTSHRSSIQPATLSSSLKYRSVASTTDCGGLVSAGMRGSPRSATAEFPGPSTLGFALSSLSRFSGGMVTENGMRLVPPAPHVRVGAH